MKPITQSDALTTTKTTQNQTQRLFTILVLTGILSLSSQAEAAPTSHDSREALAGGGELIAQNQQVLSNQLPPVVAYAVRRDLSNKTGISPEKLSITKYHRETWQDGCLGLARNGEYCTEALVKGWRVQLSNGYRTWIYRTDNRGKVLRLERQKISGNQGFDDANTLQPIYTKTQPPALEKGVVFRAITSGGFSGRTVQTTLLNDGRLIRVQILPNGTTLAPQIQQISRQQLRQFQQLLAQQPLAQFNGLNYLAPVGAADYITCTLTSQDGTTSYADIAQSRLPQDLQDVIQAWHLISRG